MDNSHSNLKNSVSLADDVIWEAAQIAKVINRTKRQTVYLLEKGQIPARKVGGRWVASRSRLQAHLVGLLTEAA